MRTTFFQKGILCTVMTLLIVLLGSICLNAEEVCKFAYKGKPERFHNDTMVVPDEMVAMSEYLYAPPSTDLANDTLYQPAIMFVIDYSGSMMGNDGNDPEQARTRVPSKLLDTLYKEAPLAEVGISLWAGELKFNRDDDPYKVECPGEKGGYCPLLQLNKTYPPDNKTGYEILKWYLQDNGNYISYFQGGYSLNGTNIYTGFQASKHAFTNTERVKEKHFNIFFSDGAPSDPRPNPNIFAEAEKVATTFTIFFGATSAPAILNTFTENVQTNGYSALNPKSDMWSILNVGIDTLYNFITKNVLNNILLDGYEIPFEMSVNGGQNVNNWNNDSTGFLFPQLFPLRGRHTDFTFALQYHKRRIYVDQNTGQIDTIDTDTTHNIAFGVEVDPNQGQLPDSLWDVKCWNRELGFYYNGTQVTTVDETMTPLEVRFTFEPGDARYNYTKASIEVGNTSANGRDLETITLTKNGNTFTGTFDLAVIDDAASPTQNDNTLQHYAIDNLTGVFRNDEDPKLLLDTLKIQIPFDFGGTIEVKKAYYFDNNAEGYVDSIYVEATTNISGGLTNAHIQEMVQKALELPGFRGFSIQNSGVAGNGLFLKVREDQSRDPQTFVTNDDKLTVKSVVLSAGGQVEAKSIAIQDKVAPIIHWNKKSALLADYKVSGKKDTLGVKFSEAIKKVSAEEPFYFLARSNNNTYSVKLREVAQPKTDSMVFEVSSVNGVSAMKDGDSLWIHEVDRVVDIVDNAQNNKNNIRRRLYVEEISGTVTVDRGFYFDNNADGYVDSLYVKATTDMEGGFTSKLVSEIVGKAVTLPAFRGFDTVATGVGSDGFFVTLKEDRDHTPVTYVTKEDKIITKKTTLSNGGKVIQKEAPIFDKVAPLIHWEERSALAILHQDNAIDDTLFVTFSEPMKKIEAEQPFYFRSPSKDKQYTVNLKTLDHPNPEKLVFQIKSIANVDKMRDGDTLWIHEGDRAGDLCKDHNGNRVTNFQNNKGNTRRRLYVERRLLPFTMIPVAVSPVVKESIQSKAYKLPDLYKQKLNMAALKMTTDNSGSYYGMIINVVPDNYKNVFEDFELRGKLTILDAVGNQVINRSKMAWDNDKKRLIWAWSVKNRNGRYVGPGMYVCLIDIEETTVGSENTGLKETKKVLLGVR